MKTLIALWLLASSAHAQVNPVALAQADKYFAEMMQSKSTSTSSHNSSNYKSSSGLDLAVVTPIAVNPITGIGTINTPSGSYLVSRQGSTVTYVQTSKSK